MPIPNTPNMNLAVPTPGPSGTPGPNYAQQYNADLGLIDSHSHIEGQGVPVPSAGIDINDALPFNGYSAEQLQAIAFAVQAAALTSDLTLSCQGDDLFFTDGSGNVIQLTASGFVNATVATAAALLNGVAAIGYDVTSKTWSVLQSTGPNIGAIVDCGPVTIREAVGSAKGVTLQSYSSLAADMTLTFPAALPASTLPVKMSATGMLTAAPILATDINDNAITEQQIQIQSPIDISPSTGWTGSMDLYFIKDVQGVVHLSGEVTHGAGINPAFTLPSGYRPGVAKNFVCWAGAASNGVSRVLVDTNGDVSLTNTTNSTPVSSDVNGITFLAGS